MWVRSVCKEWEETVFTKYSRLSKGDTANTKVKPRQDSKVGKRTIGAIWWCRAEQSKKDPEAPYITYFEDKSLMKNVSHLGRIHRPIKSCNGQDHRTAVKSAKKVITHPYRTSCSGLPVTEGYVTKGGAARPRLSALEPRLTTTRGKNTVSVA